VGRAGWLIVAAAAGYAWLVPDDSRLDLDWWTVIALAALAVLGELVEFVAAKRVAFGGPLHLDEGAAAVHDSLFLYGAGPAPGNIS